MNPLDLFTLAGAVFLFALISRRGESGSLTGPMVFTLFGLLIGEAGLDLVALPIRNEGINLLAEITLVLALFTDAARIDVTRLTREHDLPFRMLGIGLPLTMILGTLVAWWLFPGLGLWPAAVLGVILAPTDAALGQAVVSNDKVPQRIRQGLNVESGLNDGLAFPVLLIVLSLAFEASETRGATGWGLFVLRQVGFGPLAGLAVGLIGARLVEACARRGWMNETFLQISVLSLALLAWAGAELVEGNGFIAAFAAGAAVASRSRRILDAIEDFGETEGQLLSLIVFLLLGAILLPQALPDLSWRHLVYGALSLTVIRMLPVALSLVGTRMLPATVAFLGWFGPRGLASILYLLLILEGDALPETATDILPAVLVTVLLSVVLHGASAAPLSRAYGRYIAARPDSGSEDRPVFPFPTRIRTAREVERRAE
ncbi:cation:proton antiporter [Pseudoroseicyclus aestuarii]|uniref:Sodium/proton antiporter (CPA1 family) n=1 Tax=Pseudoroseicyclus aestuarii TaxID=1795041 RepID=A0A318SWB3_9RHOB|nr:cation:proton antiporter [Pseudoroseicyclus aestuarii]PYE84656.1 sodium/proton antiporter (CPA1 family) [Pseudoroseicyclus aestuarii]